MRIRRPTVVLISAVAVLATSGCGLLLDPADPAEPAAPAPVVSASPPAESPPPPPPAPGPVEVASATLADRDRGLFFTGSVRADRFPIAVGLPPLPSSVATDCALPDDGSVRTLTVAVTFANTTAGKGAPLAGLAVTASLTAADGGPPRAGTAVLVESSAPGARWCQEGGTTPTREGFAVYAPAGSAMTVEAHVVLRDAAPATDLVLRLSGLRNEAGSNATGPWDRVTASVGGCADDPTALCLPLG